MNDRSIGGLSILARTERDPASSYRTPEWLVDRFSMALGGIELDPCTSASNPCRAERFLTPDDDGILQSWDANRIYVNPPYGKTIRHWVHKALGAAKGGSKVLLLVPGRTDARWFQEALQQSNAALFFAGRLRFYSTLSGHETDAPFPSVALAFNCSLDGLRDLGTLVVVKSDLEPN